MSVDKLRAPNNVPAGPVRAAALLGVRGWPAAAAAPGRRQQERRAQVLEVHHHRHHALLGEQ